MITVARVIDRASCQGLKTSNIGLIIMNMSIYENQKLKVLNLGSNEEKNSENKLNKIEARFA